MLLAISILAALLALCVYRIKLAGVEAFEQCRVPEVEPLPVETGLYSLSSAVNALSPLPEPSAPLVSTPESVLVTR